MLGLTYLTPLSPLHTLKEKLPFYALRPLRLTPTLGLFTRNFFQPPSKFCATDWTFPSYVERPFRIFLMNGERGRSESCTYERDKRPSPPCFSSFPSQKGTSFPFKSPRSHLVRTSPREFVFVLGPCFYLFFSKPALNSYFRAINLGREKKLIWNMRPQSCSSFNSDGSSREKGFFFI